MGKREERERRGKRGNREGGKRQERFWKDCNSRSLRCDTDRETDRLFTFKTMTETEKQTCKGETKGRVGGGAAFLLCMRKT